MAGLRAEAARLLKERDTAREELDAFQAAKTSAEHFVQADTENERLIEGGRAVALTSLATLAARDHERARGLQAQLDILQAAVLRCTCGGAA
jgi:hypothetical protein